MLTRLSQHKIKREQYAILFGVADRQRKGRITVQDWATFENLLAKADAEYEIAFRLFDQEGTGAIKFDSFQQLYNQNKSPDSIPFDWNSDWASLYLGGAKHRHEMTYPQFAQMMRALQGERIRQAFHHFDTDKDGYIEPEDFEKIILQVAKHKLSDHLLENLPTLCNISAGSKISYANVRAFQNIVREMDLVDLIIRNATSKSDDGKITRTDFLSEAARITRFTLYTPMEADILFHFAGLDAQGGRLGMDDFTKVVDSSWQIAEKLGSGAQEMAKETLSRSQKFLRDVAESAHHFALGSIAGAFGAFMVYPIDLVKTRMQNQRAATAWRQDVQQQYRLCKESHQERGLPWTIFWRPCHNLLELHQKKPSSLPSMILFEARSQIRRKDKYHYGLRFWQVALPVAVKW